MSAMADQSPRQDKAAATFTVASAAIPAGVRCSACGRLHLPHRLRPIAGSQSDQLLLRCARCGAAGPLPIDASDPDHLEILDSIPLDDDSREAT